MIEVKLHLLTPYEIMTSCSYDTMQSTEEADDWVVQIQQLQERVCKIEEKIGNGEKPQHQKLCLVGGSDLYEARVDYSNNVTNQWSDLSALLCLRPGVGRYTGKPIIVNARILVENEARLMYKGYQCEPIPFTHFTRISYVGELRFTMHLDDVD